MFCPIFYLLSELSAFDTRLTLFTWADEKMCRQLENVLWDQVLFVHANLFTSPLIVTSKDNDPSSTFRVLNTSKQYPYVFSEHLKSVLRMSDKVCCMKRLQGKKQAASEGDS